MSQEQFNEARSTFRVEATDGLWFRWYLGTFGGKMPGA
jgi:hypothetical protein